MEIYSFMINYFYEVSAQGCGGSHLMWVTQEYLMNAHVSRTWVPPNILSVQDE
jgi:hypothetical protein